MNAFALSRQSVTAGSTGNVAAVLEFCVQNNYLGRGSASSVKDRLMGKLSGGSPSSDSGYSDGAKGLLNSINGEQLDLRGAARKRELPGIFATGFSLKGNPCCGYTLKCENSCCANGSLKPVVAAAPALCFLAGAL